MLLLCKPLGDLKSGFIWIEKRQTGWGQNKHLIIGAKNKHLMGPQ